MASAKKNAESAPGMRHRQQVNGTAGGMGGEKREYTPEQAAVVKRVRLCKVSAYYEILAVKEDCDDSEIKKAYRKLALALHPDKNGAPGADEAFKLVSRAFQVLSDPQKRSAFDRGTDPEERIGSMGRASSFTFRNGTQFDGELSPEDLFNMFFGGSGINNFNSSFGGGPAVFTFSTNGGLRTNFTTGGNAPTDSRSLLLQLAPLLILFLFSILSNLPNLFMPAPIADPGFSFSPSKKFNTEMESGGLGIHYFVNPTEFSNHPVIGTEMAKEGIKVERIIDKLIPEDAKTPEGGETKVVSEKAKRRGPALKKFEDMVERAYTSNLYAQCQRGIDAKQRARDAEVGTFGFGTDWAKVEKIEKEVVPSCEELRRMGVLQ